jgi:hypothetical protein
MSKIKTREAFQYINSIDKAASLASRMKGSIAVTKEKTEGAEDQRHATPTGYAVVSVQEKAAGAARRAVRQQMPNARRQASGHIRETAGRMSGPTDGLRQPTACARARSGHMGISSVRGTAREAEGAARDTKPGLRKAYNARRMAVRDVKQAARGGKAPRRQPTKIQTLHAKPNPGAERYRIKRHERLLERRHATIAESQRPSYMRYDVSTVKRSVGTASASNKNVKMIKSTEKSLKQVAKGTFKTARKTVKAAERSSKTTVKAVQHTAKAVNNAATVAMKAAKAADKAVYAITRTTVQAAKAATKTALSMAKAAISTTKGLAAAIAAGGGIAVLIVAMICMVALFVSSAFVSSSQASPIPKPGKASTA